MQNDPDKDETVTPPGDGICGADICSRTRNRQENIKVLVRIRPLLTHESGPVAIVSQGDNVIRVNGTTTSKQLRCTYDAVLGPEVSQDGIFSHVRECTLAVLAGENATVFAYGQTGSGKTYSMFGPGGVANGNGAPRHGQGVIPLTVAHLFAGLTSDGNLDAGRFSVWVSLVQLYNEQLYDMLRDPQRIHPLAIHEEPVVGIYVQGLSEYAVHSAGECLQLLRVGSEHRAMRETHMNQVSSRSHSIFQIIVEQKKQSEQDGECTLRSKFNLVDLAGSEKWDIRQDMEEVRVSEMTNINVSLYTLGRVIAALSVGKSGKDCDSDGRKPHIPYRDSKLTRLLQDSLGGNTRTRIIATLSPAMECLDESISTLRFADRAKQVMVFVRVNEHRPVDHALVRRLQTEVKNLRQLLHDVTERQKLGDGVSNGYSRPGAITALMEAELEDCKNEIHQLHRENTALREKHTPRSTREPCCKKLERTGPSDITSLQTSNRILEESIMQIVVNLRRFFRFEIEEEDLRLNLNRELAHANGRIQSGLGLDGIDLPAPPLRLSAYPLGFVHVARDKARQPDVGQIAMTLLPNVRTGHTTEYTSQKLGVVSPSAHSNGTTSSRRQYDQEASSPGDQVSLPQVSGVTADPEDRSGKLAYRVRGKHPDEVVIVMKKELTGDDEERRLRKELKLAKGRMKKNLQLQEWLLQKERRDLEELASESARRHEMDKERRRRDQEFRRRAAAQKAKLKRFYENVQIESMREGDTSDRNFLRSLGQDTATVASNGPGNR